MKRIILVTMILSNSVVFAGADCLSHPKTEWKKEIEFKAELEKQGYKVKKFKIDGNCYEIYGWNKEGQKVEIYFDTKTGQIVKQKTM